MRWDGCVNGDTGRTALIKHQTLGQAPQENATGRAALWATFRNERRESHAANAKSPVRACQTQLGGS